MRNEKPRRVVVRRQRTPAASSLDDKRPIIPKAGTVDRVLGAAARMATARIPKTDVSARIAPDPSSARGAVA